VVKRAYKYRFYPTPQQAQELARTFGCVRKVYNLAHAERTRAWSQEQRRVSYADTPALLTEWKKDPDLAYLS
jgi:putative transposase